MRFILSTPTAIALAIAVSATVIVAAVVVAVVLAFNAENLVAELDTAVLGCEKFESSANSV